MADRSAGSTPPYGSFAAFWAFVEELAARGPAPQVFEDSVFGTTRQANARYEMLNTLRFFGLIDQAKRPTDLGKEFLAAPKVETLRVLLEGHYSKVIDLGLDDATPEQLNSILLEMGAGHGTLRKARTFFLHAAQKAGLPIGPHLKAASSGRSPAPRRGRAGPSRSPKQHDNGVQKNAGGAPDLWTRYIEMLMEKVSTQDTPDEKLLDRIETALKATESKV